MTFYIESLDTDPRRNLALEQFVFDKLDRAHDYFMLWQNDNAIIVGKHQNTNEEINAAFVKEKDISVVRRLSGGGAVYHDLGNLNFTFITTANQEQGLDFSFFCKPVCDALNSFGVPAEISGRNDMTVEGKKFSGNAQYIKEGRVMHHGTILYDSDLSILSLALKPGDEKIESKGIKSIRSRVTNIRSYMKTDVSVADFWAALKHYMFAAFDMQGFVLSPEQNAEVEKLKSEVYSQWNWNYGKSPPYTLRKIRRIEGCGKIEILLDMEREGKIKNIAFFGDFFANRDSSELADILKGRCLKYDDLKQALANIDISRYFHALALETFLALLLE